MNKDEALRHFVQDQLPLLTSPAFARQTLKEGIRKAFVDKHRKRFGIPSKNVVLPNPKPPTSKNAVLNRHDLSRESLVIMSTNGFVFTTTRSYRSSLTESG
jgi:hypothetical protein